MLVKETESEALFDLEDSSPEKFYERILKQDEQNPNVYSNWAKNISNQALSYCDVKRPIFQTLTLPQEIFSLLTEDCNLSKEDELKINDYLSNHCKLKFPIFMKNSLFSNKFDFYNCIVYDKCQFAPYLKNIYYASMCLDCDLTTEVVFEELIPIAQTERIYESMPLNIEYRAFIDFDNKKLLGIVDYWHESIAERLPQSQVELFKLTKRMREAKYKEFLIALEGKIRAILDNEAISVTGVYSVDFLLDYYDEFWLIDMALAKHSWGFSLIKE